MSERDLLCLMAALMKRDSLPDAVADASKLLRLVDTYLAGNPDNVPMSRPPVEATPASE